MNQFSSTETSKGLLQDTYGEPDSELAKALKKKREKLSETKLGDDDKEAK